MRLDVVRRLLGLLRGQRGLIAVSAACRVANQTLGIAIPAVGVWFAAGLGNDRSLMQVVAILVVLALVKGLFRYLEQFTGHAVAFRLLARLRSEVFRWLERVEPAGLADRRSGDLVSRVSGDISRVEPFYAHTIAPVIAAVLVPLVALVGLAVTVSPWTALALGLVSLIYLGVVPWVGSRKVARDGPESRRLAGQAAADVSDVVQGTREIAILGAGHDVLSRMHVSDGQLAEVDARLAGQSSWRSFLGGVLATAAVVAAAILGVITDLDLPGMAVSVVVAWAIMTPLRALEEIVPDSEQALVAAARLFELEDHEAQRFGDAGGAAGDIRFQSVTVVAGDDVVLDGIDLTVPRASLLGVVGPSGSGKSTLVSTLLRHRDPVRGSVRIGGVAVGDISEESLRETVAIVPQRPDVFAGSLASNLEIANPRATREEMLAVLERSRLLDWLDTLDDGLDTVVGERGVGLSGGQLQRLALARAFLRDPHVFILDEATSELDTETEQAVLEEVYAERGRRTLIVVAHRMETIVGADSIAVLDGGRLVEMGTHDGLRAKGGLYAALWERHEDLLGGVLSG